MWNNEYIVSLVAANRHVILPIVFDALERNARGHWNAAVHGLTCNVRKMFKEMDQSLFEECEKKFEEQEAQKDAVRLEREKMWEKLEEQAAVNN